MRQELVTLEEVWSLFKKSDRKRKEMTEKTNKKNQGSNHSDWQSWQKTWRVC
jgi:hypothetical protein